MASTSTDGPHGKDHCMYLKIGVPQKMSLFIILFPGENGILTHTHTYVSVDLSSLHSMLHQP